jgi:hypothetical protein
MSHEAAQHLGKTNEALKIKPPNWCLHQLGGLLLWAIRELIPIFIRSCL